jgi:hypothetical protein
MKMLSRLAKITFVLFLILAGVIMIACSKSAPGCNDAATKETVVKIAARQYGLQLAQMGRGADEFSVINVRTKSKEGGKCFCAAELIFDLGGGADRKFPITYTSELTEDGNPYVTVYGL